MSVGPVLHYYDLGADVVAFSSTRKGGVSQGNYSEFNVNWYCGDSPEHITANKETLCEQLCISQPCLVYPHQVHGTVVRQIQAYFVSLPEAERKSLLEGVDAVMTDQRGICIGVSTADCIPVLLYDRRHHACAAIHAGWRGTVARIVEKTMREMCCTYHTQPEEMVAVIGPGISLAHFEVGDEVYSQFEEAGFDMSAIARHDEKWHIDLWKCNWLQLSACGVTPEHIHVAGICTYANACEYFSARRLGIHSGRILTAIMMK